MDETDLPGIDLSAMSSDAADLATNAPDIQINVAPSSFDFTQNYTQSTVTGLYDPAGNPVSFMGTDATQVGLTQACTIPTGTEDVISTSAALNVSPTITDSTTAYDVTNTDGGPVDANSQGSAPVDPSAGLPNSFMHGISDALTGLIKAAPAIASVANATLNKQRNPTPTLGSTQRNGAPMLATHQPPSGSSSLSKLAGQLEADSGLSPAMLALCVGAVGLLIVGMAG